MAASKKRSSTSTSTHDKAGLTLSVARVKNLLKKTKCAGSYGKPALVYLTATTEYILSELSEVASAKCQERKRNTIGNRDILMGAKADKELFNVVLGNSAYIKDSGFSSDNVPGVSAKKVKSSQKK